MTSSEHHTDIASAVRQYGAIVRASLGTDETGPISYAGLWLLIAKLAPAVAELEQFHETLGLPVNEASAAVARLLQEPHPTIAAAFGAWLAEGTLLAKELPVALETLPSQGKLDAWASDQTRGEITSFPIEINPDTMLVLASALVLTPRWSNRIYLDEDTDLLCVRDGLQAVVTTSAGPVAITAPATEDGVDVISVIAAPDVSAPQVWAAVDEILILMSAGGLRNRSFPTDMTAAEMQEGHAWTSRRSLRTFWGDAPKEGSEVWESLVPEWSSTVSHELTEAPGVSLVAAPIQTLLPKPSDVRCIQAATATYDEIGFSAAAVTSLDFEITGAPLEQLRTVQEVTLMFDRPHAVVAVARGGAWDGIPLFHAWVKPEKRIQHEH